MIDPNNFLRNYKYENFQDTIKLIQHYQYHLQFQFITKLDLSNQVLEDAHIDLLCSGLKRQECLQLLNLSKNKITDKGIYALAQIIRSLSSLKQLNLSWNLFSDYAIKLLTDINYYSSTIEEYNLSYNSLTTISAYYLCLWYTKEYLSYVKRLIIGGLIHFSHKHYWGNEFLQLFIGRLLSVEVYRLEELTLHPFNIDESGFDCILLLLFANQNTMKSLNISHNFIYNFYYRQFFLQMIQFLTLINKTHENDFYDGTAEGTKITTAVSTARSANATTSQPPLFPLPPRRKKKAMAFQIFAYDCGFSLAEIQYFQNLFVESQKVERETQRFETTTLLASQLLSPPSFTSSRSNPSSSKELKIPTLPLSSPAFQGEISSIENFSARIVDEKRDPTALSLQTFSNVKWKSFLMLGGRLYAIYYNCLFAIYQVKMTLLNTWKLSAPMKYRPPIVITSTNASKYKTGDRRTTLRQKISHSSPNKQSLDDDLPSIESLVPGNNAMTVEQYEDSLAGDDENDEEQEGSESGNGSSDDFSGEKGTVAISANRAGKASLPSISPMKKQSTSQVVVPASRSTSSPSSPSKLQTKNKPVANALAQPSMETEETDNQTYVFENEQSLLANLTKRLYFPLELLFQDRKSSFYLLKATILYLNDEINYVHFYQELIGQLNTLQFIHHFTRSEEELYQLYSDLEKYNQIVWYVTLLEEQEEERKKLEEEEANRRRLDRVDEMDEDQDSLVISQEAVNNVPVTQRTSLPSPHPNSYPSSHPSSHPNSHRGPSLSRQPSRAVLKHQSSASLLKSKSSSSLAIAMSRQNSQRSLSSRTSGPGMTNSSIRPVRVIERVYNDDEIEQQIEFFLSIQQRAKHCLIKWSQSIDDCLQTLEEYCNTVHQQNFPNQLLAAATTPSRKTITINRKRRESTITIQDEEQLEQMLFMLEDCYSQTIRLGMIDEEYIGCLHQQNIIHHYVTKKQLILQTFRQREEQEQFELEQKEQAKLEKQKSRRPGKQLHASEIEQMLSGNDNKGANDDYALKTSSKYHVKHHLHDIKKLITEDENNLQFLSLSFSEYLHDELNVNFEEELQYLSYFYHYYCFIYQKEKYKS